MAALQILPHEIEPPPSLRREPPGPPRQQPVVITATRTAPEVTYQPPPRCPTGAEREFGRVITAIRTTSRHRVRVIILESANYFGLSLMDIHSERRQPKLVRARHIAFYLAKEMTTLSHASMGDLLGGRDHSTVMYAIARVARCLPIDPQLAADVEAIRARIPAGPPPVPPSPFDLEITAETEPEA